MQAVIFDMDGVIFDSEAKGIECWKEVARRYGIQNIENTCYRCLGVNEKAVVQIFKATYGETFDFEFYSEKEREIFLSRYAGAKLPQKQGIKELLQWLKDNGIKTAVASSTNRETVKQELADGGLLDYFSVVIGGDMIERSKPAPDIFMEACRQLNVLPEDSFIIEDSYNGIRAAHAAGAKAIMVPDLLQPTEEIRELLYSVQDSLVHVRKMLEQEINF